MTQNLQDCVDLAVKLCWISNNETCNRGKAVTGIDDAPGSDVLEVSTWLLHCQQFLGWQITGCQCDNTSAQWSCQHWKCRWWIEVVIVQDCGLRKSVGDDHRVSNGGIVQLWQCQQQLQQSARLWFLDQQ
jgi:hypothetical protein